MTGGSANALRVKGRLHFVEVVPNAIQVQAFAQLQGKNLYRVVRLAAPRRLPRCLISQLFGQINEAIAPLEAGKARYRIVLKH